MTDAAGAKALADGLMGVLTQVTGQTDPVQATAAVLAADDGRAAKLAAVQEQTVARLGDFAGLLDRIAGRRGAGDEAARGLAGECAGLRHPESWGPRMKQVRFTQWGLGVAALAVAILTAVQMIVTKQGVRTRRSWSCSRPSSWASSTPSGIKPGSASAAREDSNAAAIARDEPAARRSQEAAR